MKQSDEYKLLINCCRTCPSIQVDDEISSSVLKKSLNWDFILSESFHHEIASFLYKRLKELDLLVRIPQEVARNLKHSYFYTFFRNRLLQQEYLEIYSVFRDEKIKCLPLKGISFIGDLYKDIALRPMIDIDVIIKEADLNKADDLLVNRLYYRKTTDCVNPKDVSHIVFSQNKKRVCLELHVDADYSFETPRRIVIPGIWDRSSGPRRSGAASEAMSPEDMFFSIAMHARRIGKLFTIKYLCDIDRLIRKNKNRLDWSFITESARRFNIINPCFVLLRSVRDIFSTPIPQESLEKFYIGTMKGYFSKYLVRKIVFIKKGERRGYNRYDYLYAHFLMYDSLIAPSKQILFIDKERFAKFYNIDRRNGKKIEMLYMVRIPYMLFKLAISFFYKIVGFFYRAL